MLTSGGRENVGSAVRASQPPETRAATSGTTNLRPLPGIDRHSHLNLDVSQVAVDLVRPILFAIRADQAIAGQH
jgi:hypothetical protein